jgi:WD40 repeat protein/tetratricopeptide (TPR) repeat protein
VTASQDLTARIWNIPSGTGVGAPLTHDAAVNCAAFSADGHWIITGSEDGVGRVWDADTGKPLPFALKHGGAIKCAAFSPDGTKVATGGWDSTVKVWDRVTGRTFLPALVHEAEVRHLAFSPDGRKLVTACADASDPFLFPARNGQMWDVSTGKRLGKPLHHSDGVLWAEFSPDGRLLATTSEDGTARLWDAASGAPVSEPLRHNWQVVGAQFSADGSSLLTIGREGTARVWDTSSGDPAIPLLRHEDWEIQGALSPDGKSIATGTSSGTVYIWTLPEDTSTTADLELVAQVVTGQRLNPRAGPALIPADDLEAAWRRARSAEPEYFRRSHSQLLVWHCLQAENCARRDLWRGAVFHLNQLLALEPHNNQRRLERAQILCDHSLWAEAVLDLDKIKESEPLNVPNYLLLARAQLALTNDSAALEACNHAISVAESTRDFPMNELKQAYRERSGLLLRQHQFEEALQDKLRAMGIPRRNPETKSNEIDLDGFYNFGLEEDLHGFGGNNFSALPKGSQRLGAVEFDLRGIVQLANHGPLEGRCPTQVNIPANQKCRRIHFLHATGWGGSVSPGTVIGKFVLHFAGGQTREVQIRYAEDALDWWDQSNSGAEPNRATVAWSGKNSLSAIRLFETDWENSEPDLVLMSLDFLSTMSPAAPFLVAITLE